MTAPAAGRVVVLVPRPTPSGVDERSVARLAGAVADRGPWPVRIAYLDQGAPSIHDVLDEAADEGAREVLVVPLAVPADGYLASWVARAVAHWRETRPAGPDVLTSGALTDTALLADAVAELAGEPGTPVTASPRSFRSPAWSTLEVPDRHLLVCRGPRCTVYGAGATYGVLADAARGTTTQVTPIGCIGPCNLGPLVIDHPSGQWHQKVDAVAAADLLRDP
ncbi:hypothetical protein BJF78_25550 [Pseudonocardia sp. CNS-139]|nr:hypothetical protein BJF78_25550 [Pseudonocardia sp. CNS-139]